MSRKIKIIILSCIIIITLFFIFGFSTENMDDSGSKSAAIAAFLKNSLHIQISEFIIRKTAHIIEYAILGTEVLSLAAIISPLHLISIIYSLFFGTVSALSDETIQIFSARGSQISDVLIDISGYILGCAFAIFLLIQKARRKKNKE